MRRQDISGFILAGGKSRRMGSDKALLPWGSGAFLTHTVEKLSRVVRTVAIVGTLKPSIVNLPVIPDRLPGHGPIGGIHTALAASQTDWNLIMALDMPLVTPALLTLIAERCLEDSALAIVPEAAGRLQPLCAAYHRGLLPETEKAIEVGELSIHRLLEHLSTGMMGTNSGIRVLAENELIAQGLSPEMLMNVNTPEDLNRAHRIAQQLNV